LRAPRRQIAFPAALQVIGPGTLINPIVKVVTTVAILAAIGIFIVKPILETTEETVRQVNAGVRESQQASERAVRDSEIEFARSRTHSFIQSLATPWPAGARAVRNCARGAGDDLAALRQCERFGERLVHRVQSNRNFALSYASSLGAQGRGDDASRVTSCVRDAGFETAAMRRCRNLADQLLFG
jgi:hypothetical protein